MKPIRLVYFEVSVLLLFEVDGPPSAVLHWWGPISCLQFALRHYNPPFLHLYPVQGFSILWCTGHLKAAMTVFKLWPDSLLEIQIFTGLSWWGKKWVCVCMCTYSQSLPAMSLMQIWTEGRLWVTYGSHWIPLPRLDFWPPRLQLKRSSWRCRYHSPIQNRRLDNVHYDYIVQRGGML